MSWYACVRMSGRMSRFSVLTTTLLLLHSAVASIFTDTIYLLTVNSQPEGGSTEILCVHLFTSQKALSLQVNLEHEKSNKTLLRRDIIMQQYYQCVPFQVPLVTMDTDASVYFEVRGKTTFLNGTTKILIKLPGTLTIVQTDKPIYKPGQTVKFRIVSLDSSFLTYNQMFPTVELQDPNSNRIGQWLNMTTSSGFLDLSYPIIPEAPLGFYVITAWNERNEPITQDFEIKKYVLPKFEVTVGLPPVISILDTTVMLKVCGKYTYGKPVIGTVTAVVCRRSYRFWWFMRGSTQVQDICKTYTMKTDGTGCGSYVIDLRDYAMNDAQYEDIINVEAKLEEFGTGTVLSGSGSSIIVSDVVSLSFVDTPDVFKLGLAFSGKVQATGPDSAPVKNELVYLVVQYAVNKNKTLILVTDDGGVAHFSLDTVPWGSQPASLEAQYREKKKPIGNASSIRMPSYNFAYLSVQPFYSQSKSFLALQRPQEAFRCNADAAVLVQYLIQGSMLNPTQRSLDFFYTVMSRGRTVQQGSVSVAVRLEGENKGEVMVSLQGVQALAPLAHMVVYTVLPRGEVVADGMDFPVELCLANKVSLNASSPMELPGSPVQLILRAQPGSLCSVRAIDQSLVLLRPEKELNIQSVAELLPIYKLSGYPDGADDVYPCSEMASRLPKPQPNPSFIFSDPYYGNVDVYHIFKNAGIKIITNGDIKRPFDCNTPVLFFKPAVSEDASAAIGEGSAVSNWDNLNQDASAPRVRNYFPETWVWDLVYVGKSGVTAVSKTVPDTITTWEGGAFCTSPVGFGVAPNFNLTAFQPFFISLTLPYSVIRGEVFTLKATVFNYLPSCIMVQATLAPTQQFSVQPCEGCSYMHCLCADNSWTFTWSIKPSNLGEVAFRVTAETVRTSALCGSRVAIVPEKGRVDTVEQTLLVEAEGTRQSNTYNELLCLAGGTVVTNVTLKLPEVFVEGSATAWVSVLGDLMGHALQNLDDLLAMPYGCGEQNMIFFAPDIFILQYLESSNQLTPAIRTKATSFLLSGYQRELTYKHDDGSYSAFGMSDGSGNTWLTAFVMKSFQSATRYIFIDQAVVDQARTWLGNRQQLNGCFASVGTLIHVDLQGGVNDNVTLSAYITAALLELGTQRTDPVVSSSLNYLKNAYAQVSSTYAIALLAYTFTLAGDRTMRSSLLSRLGQRAIVTAAGRHWSSGSVGSVTGSLDVETTSYVLLAVLSGPPLQPFDLGYSASIVRWLGQQQNAYGGFVSTQDTVVALQALAKYSTATYSPMGAIAVNVTSPSGLMKFTVDQSNRLLYQQVQLNDVPGNYKLGATGQGCVFVQFTVHYNIPPPNDFSSFSVSVNTTSKCKTPNLSVGITVTVRYNGDRTETNMVVMEVKLLSGFKLVEDSLKPAIGALGVNNGTVKRVDQEEGNIVIYLNGLKKGVPQTYTLDIQQDVVVQNLKPAVVKVYDYYQTRDEAITEYRSPCNQV